MLGGGGVQCKMAKMKREDVPEAESTGGKRDRGLTDKYWSGRCPGLGEIGGMMVGNTGLLEINGVIWGIC